jgi:hypothetical protein
LYQIITSVYIYAIQNIKCILLCIILDDGLWQIQADSKTSDSDVWIKNYVFVGPSWCTEPLLGMADNTGNTAL